MKKLVLVFIVLFVAWHVLRAHASRPPTEVWIPAPPTPPHAPRPALAPRGPHGPGWHNRRAGRTVVVVHENGQPSVYIAEGQPPALTPPPGPAPDEQDKRPAGAPVSPAVAPAPEKRADAQAEVKPAETARDEVEGTPSWFAEVENWENTSGPSAEALRTVKSRQLATVERAQADARVRLDRAVGNWLAPDIPRSWKAPRHSVESLVLDRHVERVDHDYGPLYVAGYRVDVSPQRRARLLAAYNHEVVSQRLFTLGGGLGFVLVCLGALAGYIRADEATKGYYTNRLRLLAAAGVGAAGFALYQALV